MESWVGTKDLVFCSCFTNRCSYSFSKSTIKVFRVHEAGQSLNTLHIVVFRVHEAGHPLNMLHIVVHGKAFCIII